MMQYIFWDEHFDVGHEPFNEQHKEMFRLQNRVVNLLCGNASPRELSVILNRLIRYCQRHFQDEEALMAEYGYADLPAHRQEHEQLVMHIFTLSEELGREPCNRDRLLTFLNTWITSHIMKVDKKYRRFFLDKRTEEENKKAGDATEAAAAGNLTKATASPGRPQ